MPQAVSFEAFGEPAEVLRLVNVSKPTIKPNEVLIKVTARPVNPSDCYWVRGTYGLKKPELPCIPGFEAVGVVEQAGEKVRNVVVGQRVVPRPGASQQGTWQEYIAVAGAACIPVPDEVSDEKAAQLVVNPLTALAMLDLFNPRPEDFIIQTAAASALGVVLIQVARERGLKMINVVRRREQAAYLQSHGAKAEHVICSGEESIAQRVKAITKGRGVKYAVEPVGGSVGAEVVQCMSRGSTMLIVGWLSNQPLPLNCGIMIFKEISIRGFWLTNYLSSKSNQELQRMMKELMDLMIAGKIDPPIGPQFSLDNVREAVRQAETPGRHGKVLLMSKL